MTSPGAGCFSPQAWGLKWRHPNRHSSPQCSVLMLIQDTGRAMVFCRNCWLLWWTSFSFYILEVKARGKKEWQTENSHSFASDGALTFPAVFKLWLASYVLKLKSDLEGCLGSSVKDTYTHWWHYILNEVHAYFVIKNSFQGRWESSFVANVQRT